MSKIVIHLGAGKTGSSALQRYLSLQGDSIAGNGATYKYCAMQPDGSIVHGSELRTAAVNSVVGYCSSTGEFNQFSRDMFAESLRRIWAEGAVPIFSQESWLTSSHKIAAASFLDIANEVVLIGYFRPQVEWFNSGWWQWWEWDERFADPVDVLDLWSSRIMFWGHHLRLWSEIGNVSAIHARLATPDIVGDFLTLIGANPDHKQEMVNQGMGKSLVKLYRTFPGLRHPHGAELDVHLSRYVRSDDASPWVVDYALAERIIKECAASNELLLTFLDDQQRSAMRADSRWWSADAYKGKEVVDRASLKMNIRDAATMLRNIILDALRRH